MKWFLFFLIVFLAFGAFFLISNENLKLSTYEGFSKFYNSYYSWITGLTGNVKSLTGYAIEYNWLPNSNLNKTI